MELYLNFRFLLDKSAKRLPSETYQQIQEKLGWPLKIQSFDREGSGKMVVKASASHQSSGFKKAMRNLFERLRGLGNGWNFYPINQDRGLKAYSQNSSIPGLESTMVDLTDQRPVQAQALFAVNQIVGIASNSKTEELGVSGKRGIVLWAMECEGGNYRYGILADDDPGVFFLDEEHLEQDHKESKDNSPICQAAVLP